MPATPTRSSSVMKFQSTPILALLIAPSAVLGLLDPKFKAKGKKYFGTAVDPNTLSASQVQTIVTADFGAVTPENSMKWDATERAYAQLS